MAGISASSFARKPNLASLKPDIDNLDIDKLKTVPINLDNLELNVSNIDVEIMLKTVCDQLVTKALRVKLLGKFDLLLSHKKIHINKI